MGLNAGSRRYTDDDVRDDPEYLREQAEQYLATYNRDFDFLVSCQMRLSNGRELTVGMIRGVLNCMRNDPRLRTLPAPRVSPDGEPRQVVVPITKNRPDPRRTEIQKCGNPDLHGPHEWDDWEYNTFACFGRREVQTEMPANIKAPYIFVAAVHGTVWHSIDGSVVRFIRRLNYPTQSYLVIYPSCMPNGQGFAYPHLLTREVEEGNTPNFVHTVQDRKMLRACGLCLKKGYL